MLHHLAPLVLLLFTLTAQAQTTELDRLAGCLDGDVKARLNGRMELLVLDRIENGVRTHQFVIPLQLLDPLSIYMTADAGMLKLNCPTAHPRCLSWEQFHQNTRWHSSELLLPLAPGAAGLAVELIRAMLPDETAQCR